MKYIVLVKRLESSVRWRQYMFRHSFSADDFESKMLSFGFETLRFIKDGAE